MLRSLFTSRAFMRGYGRNRIRHFKSPVPHLLEEWGILPDTLVKQIIDLKVAMK
ncbi:MAG: hypothetical protein ACRC80_37410 [Waterburya sp.]